MAGEGVPARADTAPPAKRLRTAASMASASSLRGLHNVVERHATRQPDVLAVKDECGEWTYAELVSASRRAGCALRVAGFIGKPAPTWPAAAPRPLALLLPRSREWYACCIAAWRLGIPVLALSTDMPDKAAEHQRNADALRTLAPVAVLGELSHDLRDCLPSDCRVLEEAQIFNRSEDATEGPVTPASVLCYVFTGGTTKHSKCVTITHSMALFEINHYAEALQSANINPHDRFLQYHSTYWGAAVFGELDVPLAFGCCAVIADAPQDPAAIRLAVERMGITVLGIVPTQLQAAWPGGPSSKPSFLRVLISWADKLPTQLAQAWKSNVLLFELLIASEYWLSLVSDCTLRHDPSDGREKHLFRAVPGLDFLLLDADGSPCVAEGIGELLIADNLTCPGYVGSDGRVGSSEADRKAYIDIAGKRYYRTKDRLRRFRDGGLVYCGRADQLAKSGGAWVDLESREQMAASLEHVSAVAVIPDMHVEGGLDAFVAVDATNGNIASVIEHARRALKDCRLKLRPQLPLNPATGKVDRRSLSAQLGTVRDWRVAKSQELGRVQWQMWKHYMLWYWPVLMLLWLPFEPASSRPLFLPSLFGWCRIVSTRTLFVPVLWAFFHFLPSRALTVFGNVPFGLLGIVGLLGAVAPAILPVKWCTVLMIAMGAVLLWSRIPEHGRSISQMALMMAIVVPSIVGMVFDMPKLIPTGPCLLILPTRGASLVRESIPFLFGLPVIFYIGLPKFCFDEIPWHAQSFEQRSRVLGWFIRLCKALSRFLVEVASLQIDSASCAANYDCPEAKNVQVWESRDWSRVHVDITEQEEGNPRRTQHCGNVSARPVQGRWGVQVQQLVERVRGHANSLSGLDSIQAVALAELLGKELEKLVTISQILRCDDVADLADLVDAAPSIDRKAPFRQGDHQAQAGEEKAYKIWCQKFAGQKMDWAFRYDGRNHIDPEVLQRAVDRLVAKHSALRTRKSPGEPIKDRLDEAASLWSLWLQNFETNSWLRQLGKKVGDIFLDCWGKTVVLPPEDPRTRVIVQLPNCGPTREEGWDTMSDDDYAFYHIKQMHRQWKPPIEVLLVPIFRGQDGMSGVSAIDMALSLPPAVVKWYIYVCVTHAYADGGSGPPIAADLMRFYLEEAGQPPQDDPPLSEMMECLEERLRRSLHGRPPALYEPNGEVYHDYVCPDFVGWRRGYKRKVDLRIGMCRALKNAAEVLGCGVDIAWLAAITCTMFRLFPGWPSLSLMLMCACRDGKDEARMVGFLGERKVMQIDCGDKRFATLIEVASAVMAARRLRQWHTPVPFEAPHCVYVNLVGLMTGLPEGFQQVLPSPSSGRAGGRGFEGSVKFPLNVRIDQIDDVLWEMKQCDYDAEFGWEWLANFAHTLAVVVQQLADNPLAPISA